MSDQIADFFIRIKNAALSGKRMVLVPHSKIKENLAAVLKNEGFLEKIELRGREVKKELVLTLAEKNGKVYPIKTQRISKPGKKVYVKAKDIKLFRRGLGVLIISTPKGLMTDKQAVKQGLGGEVVGKII